jgi:hypothetical protein
MGFGYSGKLLASQSSDNRSSSSPFNIAKSEKMPREPGSHAYERPGRRGSLERATHVNVYKTICVKNYGNALGIEHRPRTQTLRHPQGTVMVQTKTRVPQKPPTSTSERVVLKEKYAACRLLYSFEL